MDKSRTITRPGANTNVFPAAPPPSTLRHELCKAVRGYAFVPAAQDTIPAPRSTATIRSWPVPCLLAQVNTSPPPIRTCFALSSCLCQEPLHHMPSWQQRERRRPVRRLPISSRAAQIVTTLARGYSRPDRQHCKASCRLAYPVMNGQLSRTVVSQT